MRRPIRHLLLTLLLLPVAAAQTYGTVVDEAWYDQVAEAYQDPPAALDGSWFNIQWQYQEAYPELRLKRSTNRDGEVVFEPSDTGDCRLLGTASYIEEQIRRHSGRLNNVARGEGAQQFKEGMLTYARLEIVAFETSTRSSTPITAVVIADGVKYPQHSVELRYNRLSGASDYLHLYSLKRLREAGAIIDDTLTFATGLSPDSRCTFDLTQLP